MKSELIIQATAKLQQQVEKELKIEDPKEFTEGSLKDFVKKLNEEGQTPNDK